MFCKNCGMQNNNGEKFCKNCGVLLENQQINEQQVINDIQNPNVVNNSTNKDTKKWAILSIVLPIIGFCYSYFIDGALVVVLLIGSVGYLFAEKSKDDYKELSKVGKILNNCYVLFVIVIYILSIIVSN